MSTMLGLSVLIRDLVRGLPISGSREEAAYGTGEPQRLAPEGLSLFPPCPHLHLGDFKVPEGLTATWKTLQ